MVWNILGWLVAQVLSSLVVVLPLVLFIGKIWLDRTLEKDRSRYETELEQLRDRLSRNQFVHKLQFQTEFRIYLKLWHKLVAARDATLRLRPFWDMVPKDKTQAEIRNERLRALGDALQEFKDLARNREPFLSPMVYAAVDSLDKAIVAEGLDFRSQNPDDDPNYWSKGEANAKKILRHSNNIRDAIRDRIGVMSHISEGMDEGTES